MAFVFHIFWDRGTLRPHFTDTIIKLVFSGGDVLWQIKSGKYASDIFELTAKMAERGPHPEAEKKTSGGQALVQIGHYILGETLGIGTFGKVKGTLTFFYCFLKMVFLPGWLSWKSWRQYFLELFI